MKNSKTSTPNKWMFIYVYPFLALLVVHIGNENTLPQLLQIPSYYSDIALALGCSLTLGLYVKKMFIWVDKKYPWANDPKKRFATQFVLGIALPTVVLVSLELIYLGLLNIKIPDSSIFYLELPLIFIFCLLVNLIYIVLHYNQLSEGFHKQRNVQKTKEYKSHFMVQKGKRWLNIPMDDVAYFKIQNKLSFLVTNEGESYLYDFPFKEILPSLPQNEFFQLNRQVIAKRDSILKTVPTDTRRLEIELSPSNHDEVFVPKTKITDFKTWLQSA